jgi:hypothetical protein
LWSHIYNIEKTIYHKGQDIYLLENE